MKKIYYAASFACIALASCSKDNNNNTNPQPAGTAAKFSITFPTAVQMDSIVYSYLDAGKNTVSGKVTNTATWESPSITYTTGATASATVKGYGKTSTFGNNTSLYLIKTADNTVVTAQGSASTSGGNYTFSSTINYTF